MTPEQTNLVYIVVGFIAFAFLWKRREAIAYTVQRVAIALICVAIAFFLLQKAGLAPLPAYIVALVIGVLIRRAEPPRSRRVRARVKRQAIAKFEKETGKQFNRRIHELDHILPHSRGGGNAEDNIQVLSRRK